MQTLNSKKKAFTFVKIAIYVFYITIIIRVFFLMNEYESEIEKKDKIIKKYEQLEQFNCDKESEFSAVIKKYTNDSVLTIGGKKLSMSEVVAYISEREDSLYRLNVELEGVKYSYEHLKKSCVGKYAYGPEDQLRIDSALVLLPYYRDKLKFDSSSNRWIISIVK